MKPGEYRYYKNEQELVDATLLSAGWPQQQGISRNGETMTRMRSEFVRELSGFVRKWFWCFFWHRKHRCFPEIWKRYSNVWHCSKCHPCAEGLLDLMGDDEPELGKIPQPGDRGYLHWSWSQSIRLIADLRSPDMPAHEWIEMIHKGWIDYHELAEAVAACRDINHSGEQYTHPNADGAQALANLFGMIDATE